jgi:nucleoid-associated protein YgaU
VGVRRPAAPSAGPASAVFMAIRPGAPPAALPIGATTSSLLASMARGPGSTAAGDRPPAADQAARGSRRVPGAPRHAGRVDGRRRCTHPGRVTARGRVAVVSLAALLLLAAFAFGRASTVAATRAEAPVASQAVVVQAGDTLWAIANRLAPGRDPRVTVEEIRRLNRLSRSTLMVGQTLAVPAG